MQKLVSNPSYLGCNFLNILANQPDAHTWRSQTLRLLMPPLGNDPSEGEEMLRSTTEECIARVAQQQASEFLAGPASFLIEHKTKTESIYKLKRIYDEAAKQCFLLWTRRSNMKCCTLRDVSPLAFDADSTAFDPDPLVRHDDHKDQLKGRPITLLVHPLLLACGTDEAKDYDQQRVWAKGVVWLNSK
jgi:hypothetical protein